MPGRKQPGRESPSASGAKAFSSPSTPAGKRVPYVDTGTGANAGGVKNSASSSAPSDRRVPDWRT